MCVYDIAELLGASQSAVSHQLRLLRAKMCIRDRLEPFIRTGFTVVEWGGAQING